MNPPRCVHPRSPFRLLALPAALGIAASGLAAHAQTQSLAFTGGVLLNTSINFRNLGGHAPTSQPGPALGAAVARSYDNGFNRPDATGGTGGTTVNYGYQSSSQLGSSGLALSSGSAAGNLEVDDAGSFIEPSGNLEYRGSLGSLGSSDWGMLLGIGYQSVGAKISESFLTDASVLEDRFSLGNTPPSGFPPAPYSGSADATGPRISSIPNRTNRVVPNSRALMGQWDFSAELIPITGGLYLETQIAGRLNGVVSAGVLAMIVNAELRYQETSTIGVLPPVRSSGEDGTNDFIFGGFVQLGIDWALWETASITAGARWQPTEKFGHSVEGRTAEIDFTTAFAVHAGFSMRF